MITAISLKTLLRYIFHGLDMIGKRKHQSIETNISVSVSCHIIVTLCLILSLKLREAFKIIPVFLPISHVYFSIIFTHKRLFESKKSI
jgi:hypothetical protein